jgi:hypothetical protein
VPEHDEYRPCLPLRAAHSARSAPATGIRAA